MKTKKEVIQRLSVYYKLLNNHNTHIKEAIQNNELNTKETYKELKKRTEDKIYTLNWVLGRED